LKTFFWIGGCRYRPEANIDHESDATQSPALCAAGLNTATAINRTGASLQFADRYGGTYAFDRILGKDNGNSRYNGTTTEKIPRRLNKHPSRNLGFFLEE
jgi:hypothetical protein